MGVNAQLFMIKAVPMEDSCTELKGATTQIHEPEEIQSVLEEHVDLFGEPQDLPGSCLTITYHFRKGPRL